LAAQGSPTELIGNDALMARKLGTLIAKLMGVKFLTASKAMFLIR
jgi:hypothetical protein